MHRLTTRSSLVVISITVAAVLIGIYATSFRTQVHTVKPTTIGSNTTAADSKLPQSNAPAIPKIADATLAPRQNSHQQMLKLLGQLRERSDERSKLVGTVPAVEIRKALANRDDINPRGWRTRMELAHHWLVLGDEAEAIKEYRHAYNVGTRIENKIPGAGPQTLFALAIGYLRLGETENCCAQNQPESCIFPIRQSVVHEKETGSREAIRALLPVLKTSRPESEVHQSARWLLNIAYMTLGEHPEKVPPQYVIESKQFQSDEPFPSFPNVAKSVGLNTFGLSGGAVTDDFDRDGDVDLLVSDWHCDGKMHYFVNDGKGGFEDSTNQAGLDGLRGGLNMVQADYNNDGYIDVFVLRGAWLGNYGKHPNSLLRNNGDGTFTDITILAGLAKASFPTQTASWADFDLDGDLDLYVGNEPLATIGSPEANDKLVACQLFRNNGDETFTDVAEASGVENLRATKGVVWGDYNHDRWPDLYVSNLGSENRLYHNNGDGTFDDVAKELDVVEPIQGFPVWFWDYNNDGKLDLYASAYSSRTHDLFKFFTGKQITSEPARLYRGTGDGFDEVGSEANLKRPCATMGSNFGDLNNDGFLDFYLGTGHPPYRQLMPNVMYLNKAGERFSDITTAGGFGNLQKGHAVAFADFDQDGDQDVFEQMGGAYFGDRYYDVLYENPGFGNNWISIHLTGVQSNRSAIGARIKIDVNDAGTQRSIYRHVNSGGSFGANPLTQMIGLGKAEVIERIEVFWPKTGETQVLHNVAINRQLKIVEEEQAAAD